MRFSTHLILVLVMVVLHNVASAQEVILFKGDTINRKDVNMMRQGKWVVFGKNSTKPDYAPDDVVEEGEYLNNRKEGIWLLYYPGNKLKSEITYQNGRILGPYTTYYQNGKVMEQGTWSRNKNVGQFKRYYDNGKVMHEFNFTETGKREGTQKYYHSNGKIEIEGTWNGGKEQGELKRYDSNGTLLYVQVFNDEGVLEPEKTRTFQEPQRTTELKPEENAKATTTVNQEEEKSNFKTFTGNGFFTLYNTNLQPSQSGIFKDGKLWDGKMYLYNKNGIIRKIEIYKEGRYVGNGVIDEDLK